MVTSTLVPAEQSRPTPAEASLGLAMAYRLLGQAFRYPDRADAVLRLVDELGDSLAVICEDPPAGASAGTDRGDASLRLSMTGGVCDDPPAGPAAGTPEGDASLRLSMTGEDSRPPLITHDPSLITRSPRLSMARESRSPEFPRVPTSSYEFLRVPTSSLLDALAMAIDSLADAGTDLAAEHTYLFARNVATPPYESCYLDDATFGRVQTMADLASLYRTFGFRVAEGAHELPDHIAVELEFLAVLAAKEAMARESDQTEAAAICRAARRHFVDHHLSLWLESFAQRLASNARLAFYPALVALVEAVVVLDVGEMATRPGRIPLPLAHVEEDEPAGCGDA